MLGEDLAPAAAPAAAAPAANPATNAAAAAPPAPIEMHAHAHAHTGWTSYQQPPAAEPTEEDLAMHASVGPKEDDTLKLFVGQIPKDMDEDALRPFFERYGPIYEIMVIRDKSTKAHRGCAFLTFCQRQSALDAIDTLHDKMRLGSAVNCLQVRPAESQSGSDYGSRGVRIPGALTDPYSTIAERENKLFIGMLPKTMTEGHIQEMFSVFGEIREIHIIRSAEGLSKGCAFVKFVDREAAVEAINSLHDTVPEGSTRPLVVKFADNKKQSRKQMIMQEGSPGSARSAGLGPRGRGLPADAWVYNNGYPYPMQGAPIPHQVMSVPTYMPYGNAGQPYPLYYAQNPFFPPYAQPNQYGVAGSPHSQQSAPAATMSGSSSQPPTPSAAPEDSPSRPTHNTRPAEGPVGANLFIYHLPQGLTDADLATLFSNFGNVISAKVFVDKQTSESKGFGFVSYDSVPAAETAIQVMNGFQIGNKRLKVQHKKERTGGSDSMPFTPDQMSLQGGYYESAPDSPSAIMTGDPHTHPLTLAQMHGNMHGYMGTPDVDLTQQFGTLRLDGI